MFWEQNDSRALKWANEQATRGRIEKAAVIGAVHGDGLPLAVRRITP